MCQEFYQKTMDQSLNSDQVEMLGVLTTSILANLAVNYYSDPVVLRNAVMASLDATVMMSSVERSSVAH